MGSRDFRSDTVTQPTENMRKAIYDAKVGDDVSGEDPTVNELEELAAGKLQMEAGVIVPSGTFGNQLSIYTHTNKGNEIIISEQSHIIRHEAGAAAAISSVQTITVDKQGSYLTLEDIIPRVRGDDLHFPSTGLVCLENALANGTIMPLDQMERIYRYCKEQNIPIHLDGARIFNAAISLGVDPSEIAKFTDSTTFCLSKGLSAPVGSMLCGSRDFIQRARRNRKLMGGGMRQAGIIAAAGIVALNEMVDRLKDDHDDATYLKDKLNSLNQIELAYEAEINMVFFRLADGSKLSNEDLINRLMLKGFKLYPPEDNEIRLVMNKDLDRKDIDDLVKEIEKILNNT